MARPFGYGKLSCTKLNIYVFIFLTKQSLRRTMFPLFDLLGFWYFAQHWIQFIVSENMLDKNRRIIQEWTIQKYSQQDTGRRQAKHLY